MFSSVTRHGQPTLILPPTMSSAEEPPSTPRNRYLTRDERLQVQTLSRAGHT
jgi:hypothetical protein